MRREGEREKGKGMKIEKEGEGQPSSLSKLLAMVNTKHTVTDRIVSTAILVLIDQQ